MTRATLKFNEWNWTAGVHAFILFTGILKSLNNIVTIKNVYFFWREKNVISSESTKRPSLLNHLNCIMIKKSLSKIKCKIKYRNRFETIIMTEWLIASFKIIRLVGHICVCVLGCNLKINIIMTERPVIIELNISFVNFKN